jgi:hypothetical protein
MSKNVYSPEIPASPEQLAATVDMAWELHSEALVPDANRQSLTLYLGDTPSKRITIHPTWGSTDIEQGNILIQHKPSRVASQYFMLHRSQGTGKVWLDRLDQSDLRGISELNSPEAHDSAMVIDAIVNGSSVRPQNRAARMLGRLSRN